MIRLLNTSRTGSAVRRPERHAASSRSSQGVVTAFSPPRRAAFGTTAVNSKGSDGEPQNTWNKFPDGSRFWKDIGGGHYQRPIFVAATRQHVGKTTTSLALISGLQKRFGKVGFIKPVGQQHVEVKSGKGDNNETLRVDKDVCLVKEHFHLDQ